jgi:3-oxoacyl-[acyl-carrier protein] reductase
VILGDVSDPDIQAKLIEACPDPDILVNNNAGPKLRDFRELDREAILAGVTQNMVTPIELIQKVIDGMSERGFGRIVNITSLTVYQPILGLDLSSGARAGLTSFLAGIARSVADKNVTINQLLPGKLDTDRIRDTFKFGADKAGISMDQERARQEKLIPAGRLGTPEEFGKTCAFLCSAHAGYITGQNIRLDGGLYPSAF